MVVFFSFYFVNSYVNINYLFLYIFFSKEGVLIFFIDGYNNICILFKKFNRYKC